MGGEWSHHERQPSPDPWWGDTSTNVPSKSRENSDDKQEKPCRKVNQDEMDAFKREIAKKRELRHAAIASVQNEMKKIKNDLATERALRIAAEENAEQLKNSKCDKGLLEEIEKLKEKLNKEEKNKIQVEEDKEKLKQKENELEAVENQVRALKEVASIGREMLKIRELQVNELKRKLQEIESSLLTAPEDLRVEYEVQIENIRKLRRLYEERALAARIENQQEKQRNEAKINMLELKVKEQQNEIKDQKNNNTDMQNKMSEMENTIDEKSNEMESLKDQLHSSLTECHNLKSQMKIINNLFSQVLVGSNFDLDRLVRLLKENHGLITDLTATGDSNDVAALLLDIADKAEGDSQLGAENVSKEKEEIASNLSKVWRVLVELLSHYKEVNQNNASGSESCYKSIDTPSGPRQVISVSQTFLTLKDLILEKNSLVKEVGRLKTLNGHLENRMHSQERRLSIVSTELKKTWSVVSKLRTQHKQLHNHEKILRYELQHKRQMLATLRQELEHCREKWDRARQKNTQSEEDWKQLRKEFAMRKTRKSSNSTESGYEEGPTSNKHDSTESSEGEEDLDNSDGTIVDVLDFRVYQDTDSSGNTFPLSAASTEDLTEDITRSISPFYQLHYTQDPIIVPEIAQEDLLFGCNSAENISRFLEGIVPSTSQTTNKFTSMSMDAEKPVMADEFNQPNREATLLTPEKTEIFREYENQSLVASQRKTVSENENHGSATTEIKSENNNDYVTNGVQSCLQNITPNCSNCSDIKVTSLTRCYKNHTQELQSNNMNSAHSHNKSNKVITKFNVSTDLYDNSTQESQSNDISTPARQDNSETNTLQDIIKVDVSTDHYENSTQESQSNDISTPARQDNSETNTLQDIIKVNVNTDHYENSTQESQSNDKSTAANNSKTRSQQQIIEARAERLKRMEEQCKLLFSKMSATSKRSDLISNKLEELHEQYGPILSPEEPISSISLTGRLNEPSTSTKSNNTSVSKTKNNDSGVVNTKAAHLEVFETNEKSSVVCKNLEESHEHYRSSEKSANENLLEDMKNSKTKDDTK